MDSIKDMDTHLILTKDFSPSMHVPAKIFTNASLSPVIFSEHATAPDTSSLTQLSHVCSLPGVVSVCALPDLHGGYGFPIGSVAAFDAQSGIISPGGVGFDINCGVRSLATNLDIDDIDSIKQLLGDALFQQIPSGIGKMTNQSFIDRNEFDYLIAEGAGYLQKKGLIDSCDLIEDNGRMDANPKMAGQCGKERGFNQLASLGSGNHYLEIQSVEHIYDREKANLMGIHKKGQLLMTIHTGSRSLGHKVCEDYMRKINISDNLCYTEINSELGRNYLSAMGCAANYAFANRALISKIADDCFKSLLPRYESSLIYDVCHNIAKREYHCINDTQMEVMIHRKGASRAFAPFHQDIPHKYTSIGQPVLAGGSMGTSSYILTGTERAMKECLGSACHGAGRVLPRSVANKTYTANGIRELLHSQGILLKCASEKGITEEAPGAYKDMDVIAKYCEDVGIAERVCSVKPVLVIKG